MTLHVPLVEKTRHLINAKNIELHEAGRGAAQLLARRRGRRRRGAARALASERLKWYVTDFPERRRCSGTPGVIALPHLGASTGEAEDNCAVMVVDQLRDYLEHGNMQNAVNFPDAAMARESPYRLAIANANVPDMLGSISHALGKRRSTSTTC